MDPVYNYTIAFDFGNNYSKPNFECVTDCDADARAKAWDSLTSGERDALASIEIVEKTPTVQPTVQLLYQKASTTIAAIVAELVGLDADRLNPAASSILAILIKDGMIKITDDREVIRA